MVILLFPLKSLENLIKHDKDNFLISDDLWGNEGAFLIGLVTLQSGRKTFFFVISGLGLKVLL